MNANKIIFHKAGGPETIQEVTLDTGEEIKRFLDINIVDDLVGALELIAYEGMSKKLCAKVARKALEEIYAKDIPEDRT